MKPFTYYQEKFGLTEEHAQQIYGISEIVTRAWSNNLSIPFYTTHGPIHNEAIINLLLELMPRDFRTKLVELERFLLLVSAWIHDIGMLDLDFFQEQYRPHDVRKEHHRRSARWLQNEAAGLGLCTAEADIVTFMIVMHRKKEFLLECPESMFVGSQKVNVRFLAALLRIADALHIDESRAPMHEYMIYRMTGMPAEAKFHWVKARTVQGIEINLQQGYINVQLDIPQDKTPNDFRPLADFIHQELESELETVRHTFAKDGSPLLMDVSLNILPIPCILAESRRAIEINELNNLISIDVSPNARRLVTVILDSIEQIGPITQQENTAKHILKTLENLREYAKDLVPKVVVRRCHVAAVRAFVALVRMLRDEKPEFKWYTSTDLFTLDGGAASMNDKAVDKQHLEEQLTAIIEQIHFPADEKKCSKILKKIEKYFKWEHQMLDKSVEDLKKTAEMHAKEILTDTDRILLYGTSDSVIDLLTVVGGKNPELHEKLEIFVAECRVKTNYATPSIVFNDGIEYARRLVGAKYKKVAIVPDAAIAHLLLPLEYYSDCVEKSEIPIAAKSSTSWKAKSEPITKIFFGFNGINLENQFAVHSCGHLALALLAKADWKNSSKTSQAKVIMVGTSSKCGKVSYKHLESRSVATWITGDPRMLSTPDIEDYNPVDDIIKLDVVDEIISDFGVTSPQEFVTNYESQKKTLKEEFNRLVNND